MPDTAQTHIMLTALPPCTMHYNTKKRKPYDFLQEGTGSDLSYRAVSSQVLSALESLTAVFGMGTGGTSPSLPPVRVLTHFFLCAFQHPVKCAKGFRPFGRTLTTAQIVFNMSDLHN